MQPPTELGSTVCSGQYWFVFGTGMGSTNMLWAVPVILLYQLMSLLAYLTRINSCDKTHGRTCETREKTCEPREKTRENREKTPETRDKPLRLARKHAKRYKRKHARRYKRKHAISLYASGYSKDAQSIQCIPQ